MSIFELPPGWHDRDALAACWRTATPFPHIVVDDFVPADALDELLAIVDDEPVHYYEGDLFAFDATAPEPTTAAMRALRDELARVLAPILAAVTGKPVTRADLRAYAYRPGHYLLPHSDHQHGLARELAFAYYLPSPEPPVGGELELYRCAIGADGELSETVAARVIEPRANRLAVFDVSDVSLHQVRGVLGGLRISLAGWLFS